MRQGERCFKKSEERGSREKGESVFTFRAGTSFLLFLIVESKSNEEQNNTYWAEDELISLTVTFAGSVL